MGFSWRILVAASLILVGIAGVLLLLLRSYQRHLIYLPVGGRPPPVATILPQARELELATADGLRLGAWFLPPATEGATTFLVFDGNAGNRADRAPLAAALASGGNGVMLFDYRGYGGNPGSPSETGLIADARAALAALEAQPRVRSDRIVYFGESLGAAVAVALATERPPAALILRSPFASLVRIGRLHYPFLPVDRLLRDRYPSVDRIGGIDRPLLFIVGSGDRIVPPAESRALFDAAPEGNKRMIVIEGADHNDPELSHGDTTIRAILTFIREET